MPIYTQNTEFFKTERTRWLSVYTGYKGNHWNTIDDSYQDELTVMAEVQAYFQIAHKVRSNLQLSSPPLKILQ
jgi:hypothetical protein